ncbi:site-specific integrase [Cytobacillus pseudoceanisediminis]|nr:site-specific integrase [Cytobacillus pseudoceanisediminis]
MSENVNVSLKLFIEYLQIEKNYSQYTIEHYQHDISEFFMFMAEQAIADLTKVAYQDVRIYLTELYDKKMSRKSVARKISSLRSFLNFCSEKKKSLKILLHLFRFRKRRKSCRNFSMRRK